MNLLDRLTQSRRLRHSLFVACVSNLAVAVIDTRKESLHRVVVRLRNRVELMIVTPRTTNREPKKRGADADHDLVERVLTSQTHRSLVFADLTRQQGGSGNEESGGGVSA